MKVTLKMCLIYSIRQLFQTYKNLQEKVRDRLFIHSSIKILVFHSIILYLKEVTKSDKYFMKRFDFKYIKFTVKTRDIQNWKKESVGISAFGYEKQPIYVSKQFCGGKHVDLLCWEQKKHYVLIKYFNTLMYDWSFTTSTKERIVKSDI